MHPEISRESRSYVLHWNPLFFSLSLLYLMLQFQVNDNPIIIAFTPIRKALEQG